MKNKCIKILRTAKKYGITKQKKAVSKPTNNLEKLFKESRIIMNKNRIGISIIALNCGDIVNNC